MHKSHLSDVLAGVKNITGDEILKVIKTCDLIIVYVVVT